MNPKIILSAAPSVARRVMRSNAKTFNVMRAFLFLYRFGNLAKALSRFVFAQAKQTSDVQQEKLLLQRQLADTQHDLSLANIEVERLKQELAKQQDHLVRAERNSGVLEDRIAKKLEDLAQIVQQQHHHEASSVMSLREKLEDKHAVELHKAQDQFTKEKKQLEETIQQLRTSSQTLQVKLEQSEVSLKSQEQLFSGQVNQLHDQVKQLEQQIRDMKECHDKEIKAVSSSKDEMANKLVSIQHDHASLLKKSLEALESNTKTSSEELKRVLQSIDSVSEMNEARWKLDDVHKLESHSKNQAALQRLKTEIIEALNAQIKSQVNTSTSTGVDVSEFGELKTLLQEHVQKLDKDKELLAAQVQKLQQELVEQAYKPKGRAQSGSNQTSSPAKSPVRPGSKKNLKQDVVLTPTKQITVSTSGKESSSDLESELQRINELLDERCTQVFKGNVKVKVFAVEGSSKKINFTVYISQGFQLNDIVLTSDMAVSLPSGEEKQLEAWIQNNISMCSQKMNTFTLNQLQSIMQTA